MASMKKGKSLLAVLAGLAAIAVALSLSVSAIVADNNDELVVDVRLDFASLDIVPSNIAGNGPFHVHGDIFWSGTDDLIGNFECWGWFRPSGGNLVSQEFEFFDVGQIQLQGLEVGGVDQERAVVGGTGAFEGVSGHGFFDFTAPGEFTITFDLTRTTANFPTSRRRK